MLLIGALPFQGVLLIGVVDLYISFDKRFSEIPLSPIRPEGADALRLWYAEEITLSPTRPEGADALRLWYAVREKPCPQHALKGQKLIAQGSALGCLGR